MGRASDNNAVDAQRSAGVGQLARLQEHERALAERLAEARAEAQRMVAEAESAAQAAERELDASLEEEVRRQRDESAAELQAKLRHITVAAEERAARYERVPDERIQELADLAFGELIGVGDSP